MAGNKAVKLLNQRHEHWPLCQCNQDDLSCSAQTGLCKICRKYKTEYVCQVASSPPRLLMCPWVCEEEKHERS